MADSGRFITATVAAGLRTEQLVTGRAGNIHVMNTHIWHAGTGNRTDRCRRALHGFYMKVSRDAAGPDLGAGVTSTSR